ncbi:MAG: quinone oxidoreductase [Alphaproteobacteria bacterium]|nr:quinone oxidoreductase [Alphaproteobacteria bacterium]
MTKAIRIHEYGGPEVLKYEDVDIGDVGPGQVRLRQTAIGLNFIDVYQRTGLYPLGDLPKTLGMEAAGVIEEVGDGVEGFAVGDRVAYAMGLGSYAEERVWGTDRLVKLPDGIDDQTAAAMMLQGMTAYYLLRRTYDVKAGDTILVYAAAGGVGLIMCQWAKHLGATVIGCVGSEEKAELARANGCDHPILYRDENIPERVKEITGGEGVPVVYDSIGKDTFMDSLDCLRPFGLLATFGNASGPVDPISPAMLGPKGSLYLTRTTLATHTATRELLNECANALFDVVQAGHVKINVNQTYPLSETMQAHTDLEARKTTGSTVILP